MRVSGSSELLNRYSADLNKQQAQIEKNAQFKDKIHESENPKPSYSMVSNILSKDNKISDTALHYQSIAKQKALNTVDSEGRPDREYMIEVYRETLRETLEMPIEVKVERHEVNEALLLGNLGINYLDYKELKVRSEMLQATSHEIDLDSSLLKSDKNKLQDVISKLHQRIDDAMENVLGGESPGDLSGSDNSETKPVDELFMEAGLNSIHKMDILNY